jgi:hypothetical protein
MSLADEIKEYQTKLVGSVEKLVIYYTKKIEEASTRDAPKFISIYSKFEKKRNLLEGEIGVDGDDPIAAYIEFGTGLFAKDLLSKYPKWIADIAWQFYVTGEGTLKSSPYLYNNFLRLETEFLKDLDKLIDG